MSMKILTLLYRKRPLEVYICAALVYVLLFLNGIELFDHYNFYRFDFDDLFYIRRSVVYGFIGGMGDQYLGSEQALLFFWVVSVIYVALIVIKARQISNWLWNDSHLQPKRFEE